MVQCRFASEIGSLAAIMILLGGCPGGQDPADSAVDDGAVADGGMDGSAADANAGDGGATGDAGPDSGFPPDPDPFTLQGAVVGVNDATADDWMPHLRDDGLELFFASTRLEDASDVDNDWNIWVSTRPDTASDWSAPVLVDALVRAGTDWNPVLSDDGLTLYFGRGTRTAMATRSSAALPDWMGIVEVASLNVPGYDTRPADFHRRADGSEVLTLLSDRPGALGGDGDYDIFIATRPDADSDWTVTNGGMGINSMYWDSEATLSSDLLTMYLQSRREGNIYRLFKATRATDTGDFMIDAVNTEFFPSVATTETAQPHLVPDGNTLYYAYREDGGTWDIHFAAR